MFINEDCDNKIIYMSDFLNESSRVSPENAFTLLTYYGYTPKEGQEEIVWDKVNDYESYDDLDEYGFCITIDESYYNAKGKEACLQEAEQMCKEKGQRSDYLLLRKRGILELIHYSKDINGLINKAYVASERRIDDGGGSFSIGLYVLSLEDNRELLKEANWYKGVYSGYYYECIDDLSNGEKCGGKNISQKEFFIPRNVESIKWDIK